MPFLVPPKSSPGPGLAMQGWKTPQPAFAVENLIQSTPPLTLIILICSLSHRTSTKFVSSYNPTAARIQARDCPGIGVPSLQTLCVFYSHQPARVFFAICVIQSRFLASVLLVCKAVLSTCFHIEKFGRVFVGLQRCIFKVRYDQNSHSTRAIFIF